MARDGEVDCIMKGKTETGALMKVLVNRERGIRKNDTMSLLAFMESPNYHKVFAITDVGLLTYPSKDQKKAAIQNAVEAFHALGVEQPKVAILAAVEKGVISVTCDVDTTQLGQYSVEAVTSYIEDGRTNSFYNVDINFLDRAAVEKMRREADTDEKASVE